MGKPTWNGLNRRIIRCRLCPRLRTYCREIGRNKRRAYDDWDYWSKPVPNFGANTSRLLIVGLAPAAHGANRTGRMFTGDRSGDWLYRALHKAGFASQERAVSRDDGLVLNDCAITAVCHCAPPDNKPTRAEIASCGAWLSETFDLLPIQVVLALGQIAWKATLDEIYRREWITGRRPKFAHGQQIDLDGHRLLLGSYHPSQQNTFTGRLTESMLDHVMNQARLFLRVRG